MVAFAKPSASAAKFFVGIATLTCIGLLSAAYPAAAHHALGGRIPTNFFEGFISGLAHPVIGLDHFAFVVAIGLLCIGQTHAFVIPATFVLAAMAGTGIHLLHFDLPATEFVISASVIVLGAMLIVSKTQNWIMLAGLGAIAGLFHGYAYGESIVGAQITPLIAYLAGFSLIQYGVAMSACLMGNVASQKLPHQFFKMRRLAGIAICSIGIVFMASSLAG
ncbi:MAG TPA: urease accessory protein UreJ [Cyanobacteria bacterium UBA8553]|nr:urease accessory protein UreJ [Cyanobacteria bacterium UBA8553]